MFCVTMILNNVIPNLFRNLISLISTNYDKNLKQVQVDNEESICISDI